MFGVVDRLMFRPFPMLNDPPTAQRVYLRWLERDAQRTSFSFEYARYLDFQRWTTSFTKFAAFFTTTESVGHGAAARERLVAAVSASYFDFFDVRPALGRFFTPDEDVTPVGAPVAVLSHGYWLSEFGSRNVIGEPVQIGDVTYTIVGVAPEGFSGVAEGSPRAAFVPITAWAGTQPGEDGRTYYHRYNWGWMEMMVRRRADVSVDAASADLTNAYVRSWNVERESFPQLAPADVAKPHVIAGPLKTAAGPDAGLEARTALWVTGVTGIVLLIACSNVANLFLGRALRRRREVALRLALGVRRSRLVTQTMIESLVVAGVGCALGVVVAQIGGRIMGSLFLPEWESFSLFGDVRTLSVAIAAALGAALLTGVIPAVLATRTDLARSLKAGSREGTYHRSRTRTALLIAQGALSVLLLVGAGLFVRSLDRARDMRMGFDTDRILMVRYDLRGATLDDSGTLALRRRLLETAQSLPGVDKAALVSSVPFWSTASTRLIVPGIDSVQRLGRFTYQQGSADYFPTMGTRIIRGRGFSPDDRAGAARVAIVSEGMAAVLWPEQDALGRCIRVGADSMPCSTVVGIAENAVQNSLTDAQMFRYYLPMEQFRPMSASYLMVRTRAEPSRDRETIRLALQRLMPGEGYVATLPLSERIGDQQRSWEIGAKMFVVLGLLALVVAAIGLYAVIGYNVTQRMHEIGVRIAIGAKSSDVIRLIVTQGMAFAFAGVALGAALAFYAARWLQPLLFKQTARDPVVFGSVAVLLLMVAATASLLPAIRATRADPNQTLRSD
jgi:predicted permease